MEMSLSLKGLHSFFHSFFFGCANCCEFGKVFPEKDPISRIRPKKTEYLHTHTHGGGR
ncbi:hypothetical protein CROQUDRAFT_610161 [Cronartium quercuum f. sp. fusiforme G11]|uniref:Uncharacterized protein n=1 Tax=Cronartium quercuum f. sp. fusiforme G11 TaxID=708437 RepID=A0A9P6TAM9_9BASI|nr:hypothetical protein CROQUDRAFT_610161 [Cronartium quercuum f. sp. fusiforme G11]